MILLLLALLVLAWVAWRLTKDYAGTDGTLPDRVLGAFQHKASLIAARIGALLMVLLTIVVAAAEALGAPGLSTFLSRWLTPEAIPPVVALIFAGIDWLRTQSFGFEDKAPD